MNFLRLPTLFAKAGSPESGESGFPESGRPNSRLWVGVAIATTVLLWASAFAAIRVSLSAYRPVDVACLRYLVASALLLIYALITRMPRPQRQDLPLIGLCGLTGFTAYNVLLNAGQVTVAAGVASFIISAQVGVIALLARWRGEKLGGGGWLGVIFCLVGVGVISLRPEELPVSLGAANPEAANLGAASLGMASWHLSVGAVLVFGATLAISFYSLWQKPLLKRYSAIQFTAYAMWSGTAALVLLAPTALGAIAQAPLGPTLAVIYLGVGPGVIAYAAWSYALARLPISRAGSYLALIPVTALLLAWGWLGERPTPWALAGGALVLGGVVLVNRRPVPQKPETLESPTPE